MEQVQTEDDYIENNEQNIQQIDDEFSPEIVVQNAVTDGPEIVVQNTITDEPEQEEYIDVENDNNEQMEPIKSSHEFIAVNNENSHENEYEFESIEKEQGWMEQQTNIFQLNINGYANENANVILKY